MIHSAIITVPASTTQANPYEQTIQISRGIIHRWIVYFPPGSLGEVKLQLMHGGEHILPSTGEGYLLGNDFKLEGDDFREMLSEPYELIARGWNDDTVYDHTIYLWTFIRPVWSYMPYSPDFLALLEEEEIRGLG